MKVDLHGLATKIKTHIPDSEPTGLRFMVDEMVRHIEELEAEVERYRSRPTRQQTERRLLESMARAGRNCGMHSGCSLAADLLEDREDDT